jgi:hypothetical protein
MIIWSSYSYVYGGSIFRPVLLSMLLKRLLLHLVRKYSASSENGVSICFFSKWFPSDKMCDTSFSSKYHNFIRFHIYFIYDFHIFPFMKPYETLWPTPILRCYRPGPIDALRESTWRRIPWIPEELAVNPDASKDASWRTGGESTIAYNNGYVYLLKWWFSMAITLYYTITIYYTVIYHMLLVGLDY